MTEIFLRISTGAALAIALAGTPAFAYDPVEKSIAELKADLAAGRTTSVELVQVYEQRIAALNPRLHAVIAVNPGALADARAMDAARKTARGKLEPPGPLAGIPILIKDNIESKDEMATTAGSFALKDNMTHRDAPLVARLRKAGAIILGKTNLSEWANIRSSHSISGWSAVGGQARNPYALDRNTCGSSAGSGAGGAASLAAATIGTETDGSVTCPSAVNGLVGLKPTIGMVSRTHVVPISHSQDTAGPMARSVADAALIMSVIAGSDPADAATAPADSRKGDYLAALKPEALRGVRIGVLRYAADFHPETSRVFDQALGALQAAGATLVDIKKFPGEHSIGRLENQILMTELKADLNRYLASTSPAQVPDRTLADLIAFNKAHAEQEMPLFGQELFIAAENTTGLEDPAYVKAEADAHRWAGPEGIDKLLADNHVSVLIAPTLGPSWLIDPLLKDRFVGGGAGQAPAVAGYPHLTVPMGLVDGLPVGLSFLGPAWSDAKLIGYGYAYEQASQARRPPQYLATAPIDDEAAWQATSNSDGKSMGTDEQ
jgi:amidase